jgi:hypothetical protein
MVRPINIQLQLFLQAAHKMAHKAITKKPGVDQAKDTQWDLALILQATAWTRIPMSISPRTFDHAANEYATQRIFPARCLKFVTYGLG